MHELLGAVRLPPWLDNYPPHLLGVVGMALSSVGLSHIFLALFIKNSGRQAAGLHFQNGA